MSFRNLLTKSLHLATLRNSISVVTPGACEIRRSIHISSKCADTYPKFFVKPVYRQEDYEILKETGEATKIAFVPVRAAESDQIQSVWHDPLVSKFVNIIMRKGKKELARSILEQAFENIKRTQLKKYYEATTDAERDKIITNPYEIFHRAVENCRPLLETTPMKRGGTTYRVPIPLGLKKSQFLAMKWLVEAAKDKESELRFYTKLSWEIIDGADNIGRVVKRKQDLHKVCEANRAYAHFRWA